MRLSEKTIELNCCAQLTAASNLRLLWFGLTQKQEAAAGFDACTRLRGRLILFQFKASDYVLARTGFRRFYLDHRQLRALQVRAGHVMRSAFYAFPLVGSTTELSKNANLLQQIGLLDVAALPNPFPAPTRRDGTPRKNQAHYADARPWAVIIHSEPVDIPLMPASEIAPGGFPGSDGVNSIFETFEDFWGFSSSVGGRLAAAVLL